MLLLAVFVGLPSCGGGGGNGGSKNGNGEVVVMPPGQDSCTLIYDAYDDLVDLSSPEGRATALAGCRISYCDTGTQLCGCCETLFGRTPAPPPTTADDHSNVRSGATSLALGGSRAGRIERAGDVDFFRITLTESGTLTFYTTGSLDTVGQLQDASGLSIGQDDDGGTDSNFNIEHPQARPGTYFVRVSGYQSNTGNYTVFARFLGETTQPPPSNRRPRVRTRFEDLEENYNANEPWIFRWQSENLDTYFSDPDDNTLAYTATSDDRLVPVAINPFASSGRVVWILAHGDGSEGIVLATITVTATNLSGESIDQSFTVTLFPVATEPPPSPSAREIVFTTDDRCNDGLEVSMRFSYEFDDTFVNWATGLLSARGSDTTTTVSCAYSNVNEVCYGARVAHPDGRRQWRWGHDIDRSRRCSDCCVRCPDSGRINRTLGFGCPDWNR